MTRKEFDCWVDEWFTAFPDSLAWLNKLANPSGTLETWFKCLSRCNYADVALVTDKIITGELAAIEAYQREQTALHVRAYAGRIADDRAKRMRRESESQQAENRKAANRNDNYIPMAGMYKAIIEFREEATGRGLTGRDVNEYASEKLEQWVASQNGDLF